MNHPLKTTISRKYCAYISKYGSVASKFSLKKSTLSLYFAASALNISPYTDFYPMPYEQPQPVKVEISANHLYPFEQQTDINWHLISEAEPASSSAEFILPKTQVKVITNEKPQPAKVYTVSDVSQAPKLDSIPSKVIAEVTPLPTNPPIVRQAAVAPEQLETWFQQYGAQYNVDPYMLRQIAHCESTFRPDAVNGPYLGLFQFVSSTWQSNRRAMGLDPDPALRANPEEAIKTAAFKMGRDGYGAWPSCSQKALAQR